MNTPPRLHLLEPIVPVQGLVEVYAWRGVGKTLFTLSVAHAIALGNGFLGWRGTGEPIEVLYVDGELPLATISAYLRPLVPAAERFHLLTPDLLRRSNPDIGDSQGQAFIESELGDAKLLVLDNLSALTHTSLSENADTSWAPIQDWILRLRRRGISVIVVHHSGKGGLQRGTSRKEDVMDTVLALKWPPGYRPRDGCRFEVHYEKLRSAWGAGIEPFEVRYEVRDGVAMWLAKAQEVDERATRASELKRSGKTVRQIAEEMGISKSAAQRLLEKGAGDARKE